MSDAQGIRAAESVHRRLLVKRHACFLWQPPGARLRSLLYQPPTCREARLADSRSSGACATGPGGLPTLPSGWQGSQASSCVQVCAVAARPERAQRGLTTLGVHSVASRPWVRTRHAHHCMGS